MFVILCLVWAEKTRRCDKISFASNRPQFKRSMFYFWPLKYKFNQKNLKSADPGFQFANLILKSTLYTSPINKYVAAVV